jgi:AraC family transcriptional regulator
MAGFASVVEDDGVVLRSADVNGFTVGELTFPSGYVQAPFEPDLPYLAVVIGGGLEKSFRGGMPLRQGAALTMPAGATHGARFGPDGARVVIVKARGRASEVRFDRLRRLRGLGLLARRLSSELRASDAAAPLAAEGIALELLAATARELATRERAPWLQDAEELLRVRHGECVRLGDVARELGVPAVRIARAFRERHGVSVGEYGRQARIEWAAAEIAGGDRPLAEIAAEAGFADQSHFTRLFRRHLGTTPGRFRAFQSG